MNNDYYNYPKNFKEWYRKLHEYTKDKPKINYFRDRTWTLAWTFCDREGNKKIHYINEIWMGGVMIWSKRPSNYYRFATREEAENFAKRCLWDEKDPNNKTYKIVQY